MRKARACFVFIVILNIFFSSSVKTATAYEVSEVPTAWDGTDENRLKPPTADYDYTYGDEATFAAYIAFDDSAEVWLDRHITDASGLIHLFQPYPADLMEMRRVSPLVNSPKNDLVQLLNPVEEATFAGFS